MLRISRSVTPLRKLIQRNQLVQRKCSNQSQASKPAEVKKPSLKEPPSQSVPTPPPPKKGGGVLLTLTAVAVGSATSVIAYASYDPEFRKQVTDNVPYSKEVLDYMLGSLSGSGAEQDVGKVQQPLSRQSQEGMIVSDSEVEAIKQQSLLPTKQKEVPEQTITDKHAENEVLNRETKLEKQNREEAEKKLKKQQEKERIERQIQLRKSEQAAKNKALESTLDQYLQEARDILSIAIEAQKNATDAIREHSKELKSAMDSTGEVDGTEGKWDVVTVAHTGRYEATETAENLAQKARIQMEKIRVTVENGKKQAVTKGNQKLREAENKLNQIKLEFQGAVSEVHKAQSEAKLMNDYRNLIKKGKEQFKKELESIMPEVKIKQSWGGKMSEEDLNALIAHAHRRIEQLQKQLAEQQALEVKRTDDTLDKQRDEYENMTVERVRTEQEKLLLEFEVEKELLEKAAKEQMEDKIREQLSRQAEEFAVKMATEKRKIEDKVTTEYAERLSHERLNDAVQFNKEVGGFKGRLAAIEVALAGPSVSEVQGKKARKLWLACQTLSNLIEFGKEGAETEEEQRKPLSYELQAIKKAGNEHPIVNTLIESIPKEVVQDGVYTEDALMQRFKRVRKVCRNVAMIDETRNSLFRYFISYLQSMFVFTQGKPLSTEDEFDPEMLSAFNVIDNATHYIEKGDLEQALKFMNLLTGESRKVARDWIKDTRLLLETKQVSDVLLAHASANGMGSLY